MTTIFVTVILLSQSCLCCTNSSSAFSFVDDILYTQDQRFLPIHEDGSNVWILKLTNPKVKDSGEYECQVSYHEDVEKKLTMPISLTVLGKKYYSKLLQIMCTRSTGDPWNL